MCLFSVRIVHMQQYDDLLGIKFRHNPRIIWYFIPFPLHTTNIILCFQKHSGLIFNLYFQKYSIVQKENYQPHHKHSYYITSCNVIGNSTFPLIARRVCNRSSNFADNFSLSGSRQTTSFSCSSCKYTVVTQTLRRALLQQEITPPMRYVSPLPSLIVNADPQTLQAKWQPSFPE